MKVDEERQKLLKIADIVLAASKKQGATQAELSASTSQGFSVSARLGQVETVEHQRDRGIGVTVYFGKRSGFASTNDTNEKSLHETVAAACDIAQSTMIDEHGGLADPNRLAKEHPDLGLSYPWNIDVSAAIELAIACDNKARFLDPKIKSSDGADVSAQEGVYLYANSHGFVGCYPASRYGLSCRLIAEDNGNMERDSGFTIARDPSDLHSIEKVAEEAATKVLARLQARSLSTREAPVIFSADIASGLLSSFISAITGARLYRKSSFLVDHLGKEIFPRHIDIYEEPHLKKGLGSAPYDAEGVSTQPKHFVKEGVLTSYVLSSYSARQLGLETTGNAGGVYNLRVSHGNDSLPELLKKMDTGLLVTDVMGQGINLVTGDYSRGASGFWVEQGQIQYPVHEITIAGNLKTLFQGIIAIGNDIDLRGNICCGSILIDRMMIAGLSA